MSLQEIGKKIRRSLKGRYCDIVTVFFVFDMPDDLKYSMRDSIQLFATAGIRNSYVGTVARDMKAAGYSCQTGETVMGRINPLNSIEVFNEGKKANDYIIDIAV